MTNRAEYFAGPQVLCLAQRTRKSCAQEKLVQRGTLEDEGEREDQKHNCRRAKQDYLTASKPECPRIVMGGPHPKDLSHPIPSLRRSPYDLFATLSGMLCRKTDTSCP